MQSFTGYLICIILWCLLLFLLISSFSCFWNNLSPLLVMHVLTYFLGWDLRWGQISRRTSMSRPTTKMAQQCKKKVSRLKCVCDGLNNLFSAIDYHSFCKVKEGRTNTQFVSLSVTNPYWPIHAGILEDHRSLLRR